MGKKIARAGALLGALYPAIFEKWFDVLKR
jgi:hypothetical protein